jgi:hypothetical protein
MPIFRIESKLVGPPAEFFAQIEICDVCADRRRLQSPTVKARRKLRIGMRTNVHENFNSVFLKQFQKGVERMV